MGFDSTGLKIQPCGGDSRTKGPVSVMAPGKVAVIVGIQVERTERQKLLIEAIKKLMVVFSCAQILLIIIEYGNLQATTRSSWTSPSLMQALL